MCMYMVVYVRVYYACICVCVCMHIASVVLYLCERLAWWHVMVVVVVAAVVRVTMRSGFADVINFVWHVNREGRFIESRAHAHDASHQVICQHLSELFQNNKRSTHMLEATLQHVLSPPTYRPTGLPYILTDTPAENSGRYNRTCRSRHGRLFTGGLVRVAIRRGPRALRWYRDMIRKTGIIWP